ncbi:SIMPL domain-containing protein [Croceimicrobium hydrocarbonivorans]|uniref:SIMPL domain-containing protein n=1 Tax=Croceimicrobium hydrocarbonivorans TaxID=2761580 RepID=A0A7H0VHI9_9FLAO|nr:SIMPL domain-containing protein [Croceimicrobium hydrocarbonivorans]QNR25187.1 SIMPL domain-containing protein [Croceimicrobium hydrocarbonivorans]
MNKILSLSILFFCSFFSLNAQSTDIQNQAYILVEGTATKSIVPNQIFIEITLAQDGRGKVEESIAVQEKNLLAGLKEIEIPADRLSKEDFNSGFVKVNWLIDEQIERANYILELKSPEEVSKVFGLLFQLKAEFASIVRTSHTELDSLMESNEIDAILKAKSKAQKLIEALGGKLGEPLIISEYSDIEGTISTLPGLTSQRAYVKTRSAKTGSVLDRDPYIEIQKIEIEASIKVKFAIE